MNDELVQLEPTPDCPFTWGEIEELNIRLKNGYDANRALDDKRAQLVSMLDSEGLLSDVSKRRAVLNLMGFESLGKYYYEAMEEFYEEEATPADLGEPIETGLRGLDEYMRGYTRETAGVSLEAMYYFAEIEGYESREKMEWLLSRIPGGYFRYNIRHLLTGQTHAQLLQDEFPT